jgi:serine/threonine protein kinase
MEPEAKNLIDRMLELNPINRLGCGRSGTPNDISAVLNHPFFEGIDFSSLNKIRPPIPPSLLTAFNKTGTIKRVNGAHLTKSANDAALGAA